MVQMFGFTCLSVRKGVSTMKWQIQRSYWKVALVLGAVASFVLAAGASVKW